jgi:hypothetical protein
MPVMDGIQFLRLLGRTHPGQQVVMLTGLATPENRKTCLEGGATLMLEKPTSAAGFGEVFAALDALASALPQEGFQGLMHRVGLHEVLQLECLGRKSSVLEVFTTKSRGRIFIKDGSILHAEAGSLQGEVALYSLLAWRGGQFNLMTYVEPAQQTIEGHWEMLLMEAARLNDERSGQTETARETPAAEETVVAEEIVAPPPPPDFHDEPDGVRIEEVVLCTGTGEILYQWQCDMPEQRLWLVDEVMQQANELSGAASVGRFDRLEVQTPQGRVVCQARAHRRLWVRSSSKLQLP